MLNVAKTCSVERLSLLGRGIAAHAVVFDESLEELGVLWKGVGSPSWERPIARDNKNCRPGLGARLVHLARTP